MHSKKEAPIHRVADVSQVSGAGGGEDPGDLVETGMYTAPKVYKSPDYCVDEMPFNCTIAVFPTAHL